MHEMRQVHLGTTQKNHITPDTKLINALLNDLEQVPT